MSKLPPQKTIQLIDISYEEKPNPHRFHLGASIIGGPCYRAMYYTFRWAFRKKHSGQKLRLFERGQNEEEQFTKWLRSVGVEFYDVAHNGEQFRVSAVNGHFGGSLDGAGKGFIEAPEKWHVVEFKTHSDKSFKELEKKGVEKAHPKHYAQMQMYMHLTGMERAFYLAVNKNDDELYQERIKYKKRLAENLLLKAESIIYSDVPPPKIGGPTFYLCKPDWCDFHGVCHGDIKPEKNCRTCQYSAPARVGESGTWECTHNGCEPIESKVTMFNGCEQYELMEGLK